MKQVLPGRLEQLALLAEYQPILSEFVRLLELHILRREMIRRRAHYVHVNLHAGSFCFVGLGEVSEADKLPHERGVLDAAIVGPYLQRLTGAIGEGLTLTHKQLSDLAEHEQRRLTESSDLERLDRDLHDLLGLTAADRLGSQKPVEPVATALGDGVVAFPNKPEKAPDVQGTLFG